MIDNINCVPYGYNPSNEKTVEMPSAELDEEVVLNDEEEEMLMDDMPRTITNKDMTWTNS